MEILEWGIRIHFDVKVEIYIINEKCPRVLLGLIDSCMVAGLMKMKNIYQIFFLDCSSLG